MRGPYEGYLRQCKRCGVLYRAIQKGSRICLLCNKSATLLFLKDRTKDYITL